VCVFFSFLSTSKTKKKKKEKKTPITCDQRQCEAPRGAPECRTGSLPEHCSYFQRWGKWVQTRRPGPWSSCAEQSTEVCENSIQNKKRAEKRKKCIIQTEHSRKFPLRPSNNTRFSPSELEAVRVEKRNVNTLRGDKGQTGGSSAAASVDCQGVDQAAERAGGSRAIHGTTRSSYSLLTQHHLILVAKHSVTSARVRERSGLLAQGGVSLRGATVAASLARNRSELRAGGGAQRGGEQASSGVAHTLARQDRGRVSEVQAQRGGERSKLASLVGANVGQSTSGSVVVHSHPVSERGKSTSASERHNVVLNVSDLQKEKKITTKKKKKNKVSFAYPGYGAERCGLSNGGY